MPNHLSVVGDGVEAMAFLRREGKYAQASRPDLILLDLNLPKKDGREVLAEIKVDPTLETHPGRRPDHVRRRPGRLQHLRAPRELLHHEAGRSGPVHRGRQIHREFLVHDGETATGIGERHVIRIRSECCWLRTASAMPAMLYEGLEEDLPGQFQMTHVRRLSEALEHLWKEPCDVVLLDLGLPDSHGIDTLVLTRAQAPDVPIVVLTGFQDESAGDQALKEGRRTTWSRGKWIASCWRASMRYAIERKAAADALIGQKVALAEAGALRSGRDSG